MYIHCKFNFIILQYAFRTYDKGRCLPSSGCSLVSYPTMQIHAMVAYQGTRFHFLLFEKLKRK